MTRRTLFGAALCLAALLTVLSALSRGRNGVSRLTRFLVSSAPRVEVAFAGDLPLTTGDPLYRLHGSQLVLVGVVERRQYAAGLTRVSVQLFDDLNRTHPRSLRFQLFGPDQTADWALRHLFSRNKQRTIRLELQKFWSDVRSDVTMTLRPMLQRTAKRIAQAAASGLIRALQSRQEGLTPLVHAYRMDLERRLEPVIRTRTIPLVMREIAPVFNTISGKLIDRFPAAKAGWSYVRDKLPWGRDDRLKGIMKRFFEKEVLPLVMAHQGDFMRVGRTALTSLLTDQQVQRLVRDATWRALADPRLVTTMKQITLEATVNNPAVRASLRELFADPQLVTLTGSLARRFEPVLQRLLRLLVLDPRQQSLDGRLALLIRSRLMGKDRHWILVSTRARPLPLSVKTTYGELYQGGVP